MLSALELATLEWKPARLSDIDDLPHTLVDAFWQIRAGQSARTEPFAWFRTGNPQVASLAHWFRIGPDGPEDVARCGAERTGRPADWWRDPDGTLCQFCSAIKDGRPASVGTIGDLEQELAAQQGG